MYDEKKKKREVKTTKHNDDNSKSNIINKWLVCWRFCVHLAHTHTHNLSYRGSENGNMLRNRNRVAHDDYVNRIKRRYNNIKIMCNSDNIIIIYEKACIVHRLHTIQYTVLHAKLIFVVVILSYEVIFSSLPMKSL